MPASPSRKTALVLSGGGFKGAFQLGALQALRDAWPSLNTQTPPLHFDLVAGISVGSLNGALVAAGRMAELEKLWADISRNGATEVYTSDIIDTASTSEAVHLKLDFKKLKARFLPGFRLRISLWKGLGALLSAKKRDALIEDLAAQAAGEAARQFASFRALADNTPLLQKLRMLLRRADYTPATRFMVGYVSLDDGRYYSKTPADFATDAAFQDAVLASTIMPIVWPPAPEVASRQGPARNLVDGGLINVSPLGDVIGAINRASESAEWTIVIINCANGKLEAEDHSKTNIAQIALRALNDIAIAEIFNNDIERFLAVNSILKQLAEAGVTTPIFNWNYETGARKTDEPLRYFNAIVVQPDTGLLGDPLVTTAALNDRRAAHGRAKMKAALDAHCAKSAAKKSTVV